MLYAALIYDSEAVVTARTKEQDDALIAKHVVLQQELAAEGKLGPVARLMPTTAAMTVRPGRETFVLDGPFAETKEQLLGFYILNCKNLEVAIATAQRIAQICLSIERGAVEVRPLNWSRLEVGTQ